MIHVFNKKRWLTVIALSLITLSYSVQSFAQEDSVHFSMKIDTTSNGIRCGQEFVLKYTCTAQFDSIAPPEFNTFLQAVKGPIPSKETSETVKNGVKRYVATNGFSYQVRFLSEGWVSMPTSIITVNGKRYETPPLRVWVKPAIPDTKGVECSIRTHPEYPRLGEQFWVILTCNRQPDAYNPLLVINNLKIEPTGRGISLSKEKEEYQFEYSGRAESGGDFTCSVENLTFGGTPYTLTNQLIKINTEGAIHTPGQSTNSNSKWIGIIAAIAYIALIYLFLWLRFHKEADKELASFVLQHHKLNLNTNWAYTHYAFPLTLLLIPLVFIIVNLHTYHTDGEPFLPLFWCGLLPVILSYIIFRSQRAKLNFQPIATSLSTEEIQQAIEAIAKQNNWTIDYLGADCIVAHTNPSRWSLTWGEQIFIVFDQQQVWVNSINDLNKRSAAISFGYTKKNVQLVKEALRSS